MLFRSRKASIFSGADEARWMGWLDLPQAAPEVAIGSAALREAIRSHEADTVVVIGMGGSSLWPAVLGRTFHGAADHGAAVGSTESRRSPDPRENGRG